VQPRPTLSEKRCAVRSLRVCQCDKEQYPSGYCHDAYHAVEEGDTLLFSMQFVKKEPGANGTEHWDMHWNVEGHPLKGAIQLLPIRVESGCLPRQAWVKHTDGRLKCERCVSVRLDVQRRRRAARPAMLLGDRSGAKNVPIFWFLSPLSRACLGKAPLFIREHLLLPLNAAVLFCVAAGVLPQHHRPRELCKATSQPLLHLVRSIFSCSSRACLDTLILSSLS
jgi:hypothetical protein